MIEKFVKPNDPILLQIAKAIKPEEIQSLEIQETIGEMLNIAYGKQIDRNKPLLVGLAAPQIGISKRIILVDVLAQGKGNVGYLTIYINPEITWRSEEKNDWYEGCYSTDRVCGIVSRSTKIKIEALSRTGEPIKEEHEGYTARIFQHEIDHLNGREFVSHVKDDNNLHWVEEDEFPKYRDNEGWRNWPNKCPREKWEKIKGNRK